MKRLFYLAYAERDITLIKRSSIYWTTGIFPHNIPLWLDGEELLRRVQINQSTFKLLAVIFKGNPIDYLSTPGKLEKLIKYKISFELTKNKR